METKTHNLDSYRNRQSLGIEILSAQQSSEVI
jgi:hypothetical protein